MDVLVERVDPERHLSWRWHPAAIDITIDYTPEPTTLVEFDLTEAASGTLLRVVESGFDQLPVGRRTEAFRINDEGWTQQMGNLERYVGQG
jgi:uncharacterized protein YndB with AHSA1/START domain